MKFLPFAVLLLISQRSIAQLAHTQDHSNVLYSGIVNPIVITTPGVPASALTLIPSVGDIRPDTIPGQYLWEICHWEQSQALLTIQKRTAGKTRVDSVIFKAKFLPPPDFRLYPENCNGTHHNLCSMLASIPDFPFDVSCTVRQFEMVYIPKGQDMIERVNVGSRLDGHNSSLAQQAKPGDKYIFRKFHFTCGCDDTVRRVEKSLTITIN